MSDLDIVLRQHVKRTPELPADNERVLLWFGSRWIEVKYWDGYCWYDDGDYVDIVDGQYWLPLPTFDPSEVQE